LGEKALDTGLTEVLNRLNEIERELSALKLKVGVAVAEQLAVEGSIEGFLALRGEVSRVWVGEPFVLEEFRKSRGHGR